MSINAFSLPLTCRLADCCGLMCRRSTRTSSRSKGAAAGETAAGAKASKWKAQSVQLRLAMKAAKGDDKAGAMLMGEAQQVRALQALPH